MGVPGALTWVSRWAPGPLAAYATAAAVILRWRTADAPYAGRRIVPVSIKRWCQDSASVSSEDDCWPYECARARSK